MKILSFSDFVWQHSISISIYSGNNAYPLGGVAINIYRTSQEINIQPKHKQTINTQYYNNDQARMQRAVCDLHVIAIISHQKFACREGTIYKFCGVFHGIFVVHQVFK